MIEQDNEIVRRQEAEFLKSPRGEFVSAASDRLPFEYNPLLDIVVLGGTAYTAELFRDLGRGPDALGVGSVVRLERRDPDGVLHLRRLPAIQELLDEDKTR